MHPAEQNTRLSVWRVIVLAIFGIVIGIPALLFLTLITDGVIWIPVFGLAVFAPFIVANYLLWGRCLSRDLPKEPEATSRGRNGRGHQLLVGAFWAALALFGLYFWFQPFVEGMWANPSPDALQQMIESGRLLTSER